MPNSETFSIKPIRELIDKYREEGMVIVDPFARNSDIGTITNDLDPETKAMYHKDATDFLCHLDDNIADILRDRYLSRIKDLENLLICKQHNLVIGLDRRRR